MLSIGQAARALGLSADTLRYYDRIGLLRPSHRGANGRRYYGEADLQRLRFVRRAQTMGYRLAQIREMLAWRERPASARPAMQALARQRLAEVEQRLAALTQLRNELALMLALCEGADEGCPILERIGDDGT